MCLLGAGEEGHWKAAGIGSLFWHAVMPAGSIWWLGSTVLEV
jgi:hypothetical protein